ncbi:IS110 family transposase [Oscillospiraceae bacterium HV4-5-C5C]|nr:IS110 family transposase [Oscillospiraceae bacterium HV4-5-C5C]
MWLQGSRTPISKRGSPYLRRALFRPAFVAAFNDPELSAYYQRIRQHGKHHGGAVGAVASKRCYLVFVVLAEKRRYETSG